MFVDGATFRRLVRARDLLADTTQPVRAIAAQVRLSPSYFIRAFAALFGDTPHQFRTRVRVERAKALLAGGMTVTETCLEVGFSSLPSFSGLFTRWVGAPPTRYRTIVAVPAPAILVPGCLGMLAQLPVGVQRSCPPDGVHHRRAGSARAPSHSAGRLLRGRR